MKKLTTDINCFSNWTVSGNTVTVDGNLFVFDETKETISGLTSFFNSKTNSILFLTTSKMSKSNSIQQVA